MASSLSGCIMCQSLYVKANGEMVCWDDIGEDLKLRKLDEGALQNAAELPIFYGAELLAIRQSYIKGQDPFPGICKNCAMYGVNGIKTSLQPRIMEVLHLEPSYLCHLSCPQCIPAGERKAQKPPPYNMTPKLFEGLLQQLRREGVERIRFILFEGRGDPLVNSRLDDMIAFAKHYYPKSLIGLTTHCSYSYMPWIVHSGLDVLRASIDGATAESYLKYRVGGNFEQVIGFLRKLRDDRIQIRSSLRVEWKYILFEWNDSPEEMQLAAELAKELQVHLTFVRTHSPGHSNRFKTDHELQEFLQRRIPGCALETTFPLKPYDESALSNAVIAEHVAALLSMAIDRLDDGDELGAFGRLVDALKHDPGISILDSSKSAIGKTIRIYLPSILAHAHFPSTLTWLAALSFKTGDAETSDTLLSRYIEMAPNALDRKHILADRFIRAAIRDAGISHIESSYSNLRQAIGLELDISVDLTELENPIHFCLQRIQNGELPPSIIAGVASVAFTEKKYLAARSLFRAYLKLAPNASNRKQIGNAIANASMHLWIETLQKAVSSRVVCHIG
jgi:molybdenum cofactor biosynthesis enzyme MoaA